ncbi:MAG: hypothetical protein H7831_13725 [Magnetococcus sp. WYHC-3]
MTKLSKRELTKIIKEALEGVKEAADSVSLRPPWARPKTPQEAGKKAEFEKQGGADTLKLQDLKPQGSPLKPVREAKPPKMPDFNVLASNGAAKASMGGTIPATKRPVVDPEQIDKDAEKSWDDQFVEEMLTKAMTSVLQEEPIEHLYAKEEDEGETATPDNSPLRETMKITKENLMRVVKEEVEKALTLNEEELEQFVGLPDRQSEEDFGETSNTIKEACPFSKKEEKIEEKAPPGREVQVRALKKEPGVKNPFATAWASFNKSKEGK